MDSCPSRLTKLQRDLVQAFFARERRFVLTGGAALVGYHLRHRTSLDLDLFGKPPLDLVEARRTIETVASTLGCTCEALRVTPDFQRLLVRRADESCVVDLVVDRTVDVAPPVEQPDGVRVHSLREIGANKICALLGRAEIRDLVDLRAIEARGLLLEEMLADAEHKDGGVSAATLAWVLDAIRIGADASLPGGVSATDLEAFRVNLVRRLRALALPKQGGDP